MKYRAMLWGYLSCLCGCETLAGYGDVAPWPDEASVKDTGRAHDVFAEDVDGDLLKPQDAEALDRDRVEGGESSTLNTTDGPAEEASDGSATIRDAEPVDSADAARCAIAVGDVCKSMPRFPDVTQVIDGKGDEFCSLPVTTFRVVDVPAIFYSGKTDFPEIVQIRAGWSDAGFHAHVHVSDPKIVIAGNGELYKGDAVEFYVAGSSMLTGSYEGTNDGGAIQVIISPPSGGTPARATAFYNPAGAPQKVVSVDRSLYQARIVDDGYEIELRLPWSPFKSDLHPGAAMGFDLAVDVLDIEATTNGNAQMAAYMYQKEQDGKLTCGYSPAHLYCDDRTWCIPTLE